MSQERDAKGHFVKTSTNISSPAAVKLDPEIEKPILSVSVSNPFKKIMYWLDQIRRHQTTTFAIKLSIPLIAIPVIVAAAFSLGRVSGIGFTNSLNSNNSNTITQAKASPSLVPVSKSGTLKIAKSATATSYLLSLRNGTIVILEVPPAIDLSKYANKQILVTGVYNNETNILTVSDIAEVTLFNSLEIQASGSAN